ncbi:MAG: 2-oxoacid:acceptor oxidoreductase family protein [Planctomycetes bacterium]|nr:2-oxoacid:acceptor oxidoreductase family protein [Planctomycetota bacterium]
MLEMTIYGRGGQGGVTLAKLIATTYFLRGQYVQAFGVYAAERSGAPLQAYVRCDDQEISNHNQIRQPDHVVVLDRTLIGPAVLAGLKPGGLLILNTPEPPDSLASLFAGWRVACIDATAIAVTNGLGTRAVPIVNTTMLGAVARALELPLESVEAALGESKFNAANVSAVRAAHAATRIVALEGLRAAAPAPAARGPISELWDDAVGGLPRIRTGAWASRRPDRHTLTPPCNHACPAGNDVQAFVAAMGQQDVNAGLEILLRTSPLPGVCGRVCPAPCMESCNRRQFDEAVNVRELERYAAEHGVRPTLKPPQRRERVAVVGSGPAGLSATYHLAQLGYAVELFESADELGGVLRTGIPAYRLPRETLDREIAWIVSAGVKTHVSKRVGREALLSLSLEFDAVFVATGLQSLNSLQLAEDADSVVAQGVDFLDRARRGQEKLAEQDVIVVGGGNTAMDAARTARRLGARRVRVVYRRTRAEMPAIAEEIREAVDEGIELAELVAPLRLKNDAGGPVLSCTNMKLGEPDESGRRRPVPDNSANAKFDLRCDRVILALGQAPDLSILPAGSAVHS